MEDYKTDKHFNNELVRLCQENDHNGEFEGMSNVELLGTFNYWLEGEGFEDFTEADHKAIYYALQETEFPSFNNFVTFYSGYLAGVDYCSRVEGRV